MNFYCFINATNLFDDVDNTFTWEKLLIKIQDLLNKQCGNDCYDVIYGSYIPDINEITEEIKTMNRIYLYNNIDSENISGQLIILKRI